MANLRSDRLNLTINWLLYKYSHFVHTIKMDLILCFGPQQKANQRQWEIIKD